MENIALSDSNDDLTSETTVGHQSQQAPLSFQDEQQHVTSELQDAANTDVTKATTPFKPHFAAPSHLIQAPKTGSGSPLLFQQASSNMSTVNPLLQPPTSSSNFPTPLIQPTLRPPSTSTGFQPTSSAFTPLVPMNNQQTSSLIQPKLTIGNQPTPQLGQFPGTKIPLSQMNETPNVATFMPMSPPSQEASVGHYESQVIPPPPSTMTAPKDPNASLPPPPPQAASTSTTNPYSARASLTERIYPSMPTSQGPPLSQQLAPPMSFQQQQMMSQPTPASNLFVPPTNVTSTPPSNPYPSAETNIYNPSYQQPGEPNPTPWTNYSTVQYDQQSTDQTANNASGIWGWFSNNKVLATVVEKAKTGIESVITTVDPQMKQYIQPGHEVHIVVTSAKDVKLTPVRDAFTHVFGRATIQGIGVQSNVAPQPVGFEAGFKGAQQRIENLRRQNVVRSDQCIVSIENFIAELVPDMYFDLGYVLLSDPMNSIELHLFTQAIPVPIEYVYQARDRTPTDYPLKWSGYMVTIGEILHSQLPFVNPEDWHEMMSGTSRRDIIYATCKSLAFMYKQRLNRNQS